jgi:hypothetical protein
MKHEGMKTIITISLIGVLLYGGSQLLGRSDLHGMVWGVLVGVVFFAIREVHKGGRP